MFIVEKWVRPRVLNMKPYSSARDEFSGEAQVFLDANENPFGAIPNDAPYNRYPHPLQPELKQRIGEVLGFLPATIFLGNGSDEAIDLLMRIGCEPNQDEIMIVPPTYGMYAVSAEINSVAIREVPLLPDFQLNVPKILAQIQPNTKIIFLCSPNNPTGNSLHEADILQVLQNFNGVVVIDEAYIDFSQQASWAGKLQDFPNLVILRTFSKAWGMAALRLGMALASPALIQFFNKVKSPYNINVLTQEYALEALQSYAKLQERVAFLLQEREKLQASLLALPTVQAVYPTDANFILVKIQNAPKVYHALLQQGIVVRNRSNVILCQDCLRITVGTPKENKALMQALESYKESYK
jgi:histidinol-phosphate aminotransferase